MSFLLGVLAGVTLMVIIGAIMMPRMGQRFFVENRSLLSFEDTITKVREHCEADETWHLVEEKDYNAAHQKRGKGELPFRLVELKLGNPDHSYRVNRQFPAVCTFMPAAIAVVEYEPDKVVIYRKNTSLMGRMFTGEVRQVMQKEVPAELDAILADIIEK